MKHEIKEYVKDCKIIDNKIVWNETFKKEDPVNYFDISIDDFVNKLKSVGFGEPVINEDGFFCRVLKGDVSPTEFATPMDAYIDCYYYALERNMF